MSIGRFILSWVTEGDRRSPLPWLRLLQGNSGSSADLFVGQNTREIQIAFPVHA